MAAADIGEAWTHAENRRTGADMSATTKEPPTLTVMKQTIKLYKQMADLTAPECATVCRCPHSCCDRRYCDAARSWATEKWHVDLSPLYIEGQRLPFMREGGCVVEPHLRPTCTVHTCAINGFGFKPNDPKWTKKYFRLRARIDSGDLE